MPDYRAYRVGKDGRILGVPDVISCNDDGEAIEQAQSLIGSDDIELWEGARLVSRIKSTGSGERAEAIALCRDALANAWAGLSSGPQWKSNRAVLIRRILNAASGGERDPAHLRGCTPGDVYPSDL
jgi:hypothetical protein